MKIQKIKKILLRTFDEWLEDKAPRLGAALAFYSVLSIGPLLLLVLPIAGLVFGHDAAQGRIVTEIQGMIGEEGAKAVQDMIKSSAENEKTGIVASLVGFATLLFGASGVFGELQQSMNTIWNVKANKTSGIKAFISERFFSITMVLGTGFLLLISLVLSAALSGIGEFASGVSDQFLVVLHVINFVVSFFIVSFMFALIFKYVPDIQVRWHDVWIGACLTAFLFTLGKFVIGLYLGHSSFSSSYGAAGSLVVLLIWIYYSAQILFLGAEFTQVYSARNAEDAPLSKRDKFLSS